jgi:hypothetical protein
MPRPLRALLYRSRKDDGKVSSSTFYGSLHRALRDYRNLKSTDPKDEIFAMLGMIDKYEEDYIDVDYAYTDERVYINVVKLSIEHYHSLDFLREATCGNLGGAHSCFPTWLPDWNLQSKIEQPTSLSFSISDLYPESQGLASPPASMTERSLNVTSCRIGTVFSVLSKAQEESL